VSSQASVPAVSKVDRLVRQPRIKELVLGEIEDGMPLDVVYRLASRIYEVDTSAFRAAFESLYNYQLSKVKVES